MHYCSIVGMHYCDLQRYRLNSELCNQDRRSVGPLCALECSPRWCTILASIVCHCRLRSLFRLGLIAAMGQTADKDSNSFVWNEALGRTWFISEASAAPDSKGSRGRLA